MEGKTKKMRRTLLYIEQILNWADAHHERSGQWPTRKSGVVRGAKGETWLGIEQALMKGNRGLRGGSSLSRLLAKHRKVKLHVRMPPLTVRKILRWAGAHRRLMGQWPKYGSGPIPESPGETWLRVQAALREGRRGLPGGLSLAKLLAEYRGVRNSNNLPRLTKKKIVEWADADHQRTGEWPTAKCGRVAEAPEKWGNINAALSEGLRGLPGGSSLAKLLSRRRGVRNRGDLLKLSFRRVLKWADAHHERTGQWPTIRSGVVRGAKGETWLGIDQALRGGYRGFRGVSSLSRLLSKRRGVRDNYNLPTLSVKKILAWADAHHRRTGRWPTKEAGGVAGAPDEKWANINQALRAGRRELSGGSSLARLLAKWRGVRNHGDLPKLSTKKILAWAIGHHKRTGNWPTTGSGLIRGTNGETWTGIDQALRNGARGLRGGSSLSRLLAKHR